MRRSHGYDKPHDVKFWCLGNEMDGPWQIGAKSAQEYGRAAHETAKAMRWVDPSIELATCGSSDREMATYARWEYEVLDHCFEHIDFISMRTYFVDPHGATEEFLATSSSSTFIKRSSPSPTRSLRPVDRPNASCCRSTNECIVQGPFTFGLAQAGWPEHPPLIEEVYNAEDAYLIRGALITLPGDLLYFGASPQRITHTGMYLGGGQFISATTYQTPMVRIDSLENPHWSRLLVAMRRVK